MALQTCPDCQHKVSESALACPQCGRPFVLGAEFCPYCEQPSAKKVQGVFGSEFVITILLLCFGIIPGAIYYFDVTRYPYCTTCKRRIRKRVETRVLGRATDAAACGFWIMLSQEAISQVGTAPDGGFNVDDVVTCELQESHDGRHFAVAQSFDDDSNEPWFTWYDADTLEVVRLPPCDSVFERYAGDPIEHEVCILADGHEGLHTGGTRWWDQVSQNSVTPPRAASYSTPPSQSRSLDQGKPSGVTSKADELIKLDALRRSGALTQKEFDAEKAKLLRAPLPPPTPTS